MIMKRILYIVFAAFVLSLVPASYACAQTGSAGKIETPKERKARLEREAAAKKKPAKKKWNYQREFSEGLAEVQDANDRCGFIDKTGKLVIPCQWKSAWYFSEGLAKVQDANGKWGFIDKTGKVVIPCQWKDAFPFREGLASVQDANGKWHKIDKTGKVVE